MDDITHIVARLKSQVSRAEPILFTGAGFSTEAFDVTERPVPSSRVLTAELWNLAFPSEPFDTSARLGDTFYSARTRNPAALRSLVKERLSVNTKKLPDFYAKWFSVPWSLCYTLNIDDLELAVANRFKLQRSIRSVSATSNKQQGTTAEGQLEVIHLNGAVWDDIGDLTFSPVDYGARLSTPDQHLIRCSGDVITRPVVFVGTELDEPTLWQYLEYRKTKGERGLRELRPGSILVCPSLNSARRLLLEELHVQWVPMTARDFAHQVLDHLDTAITAGHAALRARLLSERSTTPEFVSDLASANPLRRTEYLMGQEPTWADLQAGRAIERDCDGRLFGVAREMLFTDAPAQPLIVTGTAGSGKSTSLMRLGLKLSAQGIPTYWIDERSNIAPHVLRGLALQNEGPVAILVDDADLFGRTASIWARELPNLRPKLLFASATRSSKVEGLFDKDTLGGIEPREVVMPNLTDEDIDDLLRVLDRENRLGILKGKSAQERIEAFREQAGRQLLVAMIQATSGVKFMEKAVAEFKELPSRQRLLYGIICFVHSQRFSLTLEELLAAANSRDNETLNDIERLANRNIVVRDDRYSGYMSRHRVLADQVINSPDFRSHAIPILEGVCFAFASNLRPEEPRSSRKWRRFIRFIKHQFLLNFAAPDDARKVYASIEALLEWDYHYWLQRGSLEVEEGDLSLATNYLGQARSLAPEDVWVETEWAYLLMKKAAKYPSNTQAREWFSEGYESLQSLIEDRGRFDSYPYHVLGSQTLAWARSANLATLEKKSLLHSALRIVTEGRDKHPRSPELEQLAKDLQTDLLMTAVDPKSTQSSQP